jgi:cytochrome bd-type quinol oxidase subunit 2
MHALPHTPMGRRALWLLLPVLLYILTPVYLLFDLLIPDSWRAVSIAVVIAIIGLAVASLVTAGVAIFREKERSVVLIVMASLTFLLVVTLAVGEAIGGH